MKVRSALSLIHAMCAISAAFIASRSPASRAAGNLVEPGVAKGERCAARGLHELIDHFPPEKGELHVPKVIFTRNKTSVLAGETYTTTRQVSEGAEHLPDHLNVIRFANGNFERRGWSADFIADREQVARQFADRSRYIRVESHAAPASIPPWSPQYGKEGQLRGTLGLTYATCTRSEIGALTDAGLLANHAKIIPMEKTLRKALPRFYDSQGRSIVVELRAFAKEPGSEELVRRALISDGISMVFEAIKGYPELYDKPVIYTYGDKLSVRLYGALGFKVDESVTPLRQPIHHEGREWWVLSISPRDLEKNLLFSDHDPGRIIDGLNQPVPVPVGDGKVVRARMRTPIRVQGGEGPLSAGLVEVTLDEATEVMPGVMAAKGAKVSFNPDGTPRHIERLETEAFGFIPAGSDVLIGTTDSDRPRLIRIDSRDKVVRIPGTNLSAVGLVELEGDARTPWLIQSLSDDAEIAPGLFAARGTSLPFRRDELGIARPSGLILARPYENPETHRVVPAGESVSLAWRGGIPRIESR